ncbi:hypothetical protein ANCDUO_20250, partial [Ancylostoma duodenale]
SSDRLRSGYLARSSERRGKAEQAKADHVEREEPRTMVSELHRQSACAMSASVCLPPIRLLWSTLNRVLLRHSGMGKKTSSFSGDRAGLVDRVRCCRLGRLLPAAEIPADLPGAQLPSQSDISGRKMLGLAI